MSSDERTKKAVIFVDSLGNDDLEYMPWVSENLDIGTMDAGPVFVTPVVLGSIYTGKSPTEHGLPSISRYDQNSRLRPNGATIPEIAGASDQYDSVLQYGLPFIVPPQLDPHGDYYHVSEAMGQTSFQPGQAQNVLTHFGPAGSLDAPDENLDLAFNLRVDHCLSTFGTARNLLETWAADVAFISYRVTDSYCHYHYSDGPEGSDKTYRQELLEQVDREIQHIANQAEVFVFGDHGARELTDVFRINRWLMERGYLDVDIDTEWREKAVEYGIIEKDEESPGEVIQSGGAGVTIDEETSVAIGDDPFSTGITLLDGATDDRVEALMADLEAEDAIEAVVPTIDLYGDGPLLEECPDLYALRAPGVFVSGNLSPERGGPELTRSGVHHPIGAYGAETVDVPDRRITPEELFSLITEDFLGLDPDAVDVGDIAEEVDVDENEIRSQLEHLGYI